MAAMPPSDQRRYQVFVSSTFTDLKDERQHVLQAILEMHCFPSGMELFPSSDEEQWAFIQKEIDSSDYYVVILAGKYGSLSSDGRSFTEKEYDYALKVGKPIMAFLFHDLNKLFAESLERDPVRHSQLEAFRAKVKAGKLVRFYKNPDELKSQVWQALTYARELSPGEGWVRGRNDRRLEDLEDLNTLRKRIGELESELDEQRRILADPRLALAQDDDTITWRFDASAGDEVFRPVVVSTTWNEVFDVLFGDVNAGKGSQAIKQSLVEFLARMSQAALGSSSEFGFSMRGGTDDRQDFGTILRNIRIQFCGLGYLDVQMDRAAGDEVWSLTEKGKTQLALVAGSRRSQSTTA